MLVKGATGVYWIRESYWLPTGRSVSVALFTLVGSWKDTKLLYWSHIERDGVSNHQGLYCLLNHFLRHREKKVAKLRVTGLCGRNPPMTVDCPHKGPVTRKMFPFDDVFVQLTLISAARLHGISVAILNEDMKQAPPACRSMNLPYIFLKA